MYHRRVQCHHGTNRRIGIDGRAAKPGPRMITLFLGGTRSGKSVLAENSAASMAGSLGLSVTYVATAAVDPGDSEHVARIAAHRERRPESWASVECLAHSQLPGILDEVRGIALVDSLGSWAGLHPNLVVDSSSLIASLVGRAEPTIVVSEEVGLAVHPPTELGRRYVDAVGTLNQQVAAIAQRVLFVVAGRSLQLGAPQPGTGPTC